MTNPPLALAGFYLNTDYYPVWGNHLGHVAVTLPAKNKRHFADYPQNNVVAHLEDMRTRLAHFEKETGYSLRLRAEKDGPPEGKDVNIRVLGTNEAQVRELAGKLRDYLKTDPIISQNIINLDDSEGRPGRVLRYHILAERAAEYDLTPKQVALLAAAALNGRLVGPMRMEDEEIDIKLMLGVDQNQGLTDALRVAIRDYPDGALRLGDVCKPELH